MNRILAVVLFFIALLLAYKPVAYGEGPISTVPVKEFLADKLFLWSGICNIPSERDFGLLCRMYVDAEGNGYLLLYFDDEPAIIKKTTPDGKPLGNVWIDKSFKEKSDRGNRKKIS